MALQTTHTYDTFVTFLKNTVDTDTATSLGWTDATEDTGHYDQQVNNSLRPMGFTTVEDVPAARVHELELRGAVEIWEKAVAEYVRAYDAGGAARTLSRDQLFQHAKFMLQRAEAELATFLVGTTDETDRGLINGGGYSTSVPIKLKWPSLYGR
jgi:hypothetical protein